MSKDTFYFQHDYHARKDPKCQALISEYGMAAYGLYWSLMEMMHEQGGKIKKFPKLYSGLAFEFRMTIDELMKQIEAMLRDFELLLQDDNFIWSDRVLKNLQDREAKKQLRVEAGKLGGIKSGISRLNRSKSKQCLKQNEANEAKERKGKERKEVINKELFMDCVYLSVDETVKLKTKFGDKFDDAISELNNYKMSSGKKYNSDYHAMIGWVAKKFLFVDSKQEAWEL